MKAARVLARPWLASLRTLRAMGGTSRSNTGFRILLLHDVPRTDWSVFEKELHNLEESFGLISPMDAAEILASNKTAEGKNPVLLSFDDGFVSNHWLAREVLAPRGVQALFFVCPGLMDLEPAAQRTAIAKQIFRGMADENSLATTERLMNWEELAELRDLGHSIGAHSMTHRALAGLDGEELKSEVETSGHRIVEQLGVEPDWFAYPFGQIGAINGAALAMIGRHYRFCRSGVRGLNGPGTHRLSVFADHYDLKASGAWRSLTIEGALDFRYRANRHALFTMACDADQDTPA